MDAYRRRRLSLCPIEVPVTEKRLSLFLYTCKELELEWSDAKRSKLNIVVIFYRHKRHEMTSNAPKKSRETTSPVFEHVTKTNAKKDYFLTEEDLNRLRPWIKQNPHRSRDHMYLYKIVDIRAYLLTKHSFLAGEHTLDVYLQMLREKRDSRKTKRQETQRSIVETRRSELTRALEEARLELRSDSKLCEGYISGSIKDWTIPQIVRRMAEMRFLFDYTSFSAIYQQTKIDESIHHSERFEYAEQQALERYGDYPEIFPWQFEE